jgi:hypothetical protein
MLNAGVLTFREFAIDETLPLATIHDAILDFLNGRSDAVVLCATAVNAYAFPHLKVLTGPVSELLDALHATAEEKTTWQELVAQEIISPDEDSEFD